MPIQLRDQLTDLFTPEKLPELNKIIEAKADSYPSMIPILFNEDQMTTDIYQTTTLSVLDNPQLVGEAQPIPTQTIKKGFPKTYIANKYATGYAISKETVDDGKISLIQRATESFSKGMFEIKELSAAEQYDNGFSAIGYDGVPLFSTSHPLEGGVGTGANTFTPAELTLTSFRDLRNVLQSTVNENGQIVYYTASYLVVPQGLQDTAAEIVKSMYNPENANNAVNTVYDMVKLLPGGFWNYLQSQTGYFLQADKAYVDLMFMTRQGLEVDSDYYKREQVFEFYASCRYDVGHSGWRGVVGNQGA